MEGYLKVLFCQKHYLNFWNVIKLPPSPCLDNWDGFPKGSSNKKKLFYFNLLF